MYIIHFTKTSFLIEKKPRHFSSLTKLFEFGPKCNIPILFVYVPGGSYIYLEASGGHIGDNAIIQSKSIHPRQPLQVGDHIINHLSLDWEAVSNDSFLLIKRRSSLRLTRFLELLLTRWCLVKIYIKTHVMWIIFLSKQNRKIIFTRSHTYMKFSFNYTP